MSGYGFLVKLAAFVSAGLVVSCGLAGEAPAKCYVSTNESATATYPYDTWEKATHDLNAALATGAAEIEVGDGTYVNTNKYYVLDRAVKVYSSNGPKRTVLQAMSSKGGQFWLTHADATLSGFTLKDARANDWLKASALRMTAGLVTNCVITGTLGNNYNSICTLEGGAKAVDCEFDATGFNGGSGYDSSWAMVWLSGNAVLDRCSVHGWVTSQQLKFAEGSFIKAAVVLNSANAVLRNSLVYGNKHGTSGSTPSPDLSGGGIILLNGTIENCTVVDNFSAGYGGGIYAQNTTGKILNCIVWGNENKYAFGTDIFAPKLAAANVDYVCSGDIGDTASISNGVGTACTSLDPKFSGEAPNPYALTQSSVACVDKGGETVASQVEGATDLAGNPRLDWKNGIVDIGCYEFVPSKEIVPLSASIDAKVPGGFGAREVSFIATPIGDNTSGLTYCWHYGDGATETGTLSPTHLYQPGAYTVTLSLTNEVNEATNVVCDTHIVIVPQTVYVAQDGTGTYPYDSWEKATNDLAVALAVRSAEVVVGDGTFVHTAYEHKIEHNVNLHSLNGPSKTTLKRGSHTRPDRTADKNVGRHFTLAGCTGTIVAGFTLDGGSSGFNTYSVFSMDAGVISNCMIRGTFSTGYSWIAQASGSAKVLDCEFDAGGTDHWVPSDGSGAILYVRGNALADRCVFHGWHATSTSGASAHCRSAVCVDSANAVLRNSLVYDCSIGPHKMANLSGGGVRLNNGTVANCTIVGNAASGNGGGLYASSANGKIVNCIVWGNTKDLDYGDDIHAPSFASAKISYTCVSNLDETAAIPAASIGAGCIAKAPRFRNEARRDYRLTQGSPCVDAGDDSYYPDVATVLDLMRMPRKSYSHVDMGCYEPKFSGLTIILR